MAPSMHGRKSSLFEKLLGRRNRKLKKRASSRFTANRHFEPLEDRLLLTLVNSIVFCAAEGDSFQSCMPTHGKSYDTFTVLQRDDRLFTID